MSQTLEEHHREVQLWKRRYPRAVFRGAKRAIEVVEDEVRGRLMTQLQTRSGKLLGALATLVSRRPLKAEIFIESQQQYKAQTHEHGAIIRAKSGFLTFKIGNQWIKRRSVRIPARPFFFPAVEAKEPIVDDIIADEIMKRVFGGR